MDRGSRLVRAAWVMELALLLLVVGAVPARAAFPGANGRLVVQPPNGRGLLLVGVGGAHARQICMGIPLCDRAIDPVWSPDGSEIAFASPRGLGLSVIYPDGSCLACPVPAPSGDPYVPPVWEPKFGFGYLPDGRLVTAIDVDVGGGAFRPVPRLAALKPDGIGIQLLRVSGSWRQVAWSPTGRLAAVRRVRRRSEVFVIDPRGGPVRRLTRDGASSPSWSPDGRRLAVVHRGWIELVASGGGRLRRLIRGGAPAWAPNGKQLAFVGAHHRLFVIPTRGGTPRPVGHVRAVRVDWQPVTAQPPPHCQAPAGVSVLAATPDATISIDRAPAETPSETGLSVLGCLSSDGRERLLESFPEDFDAEPAIGPVAVAGNYAALVNESIDIHYGGAYNTVAVFDLRTATTIVANGSGASADCPEFSQLCSSGIDQLVLGTDGATAAHTFVLKNDLTYPSCQSVEQIVANDSTGTRALDSITTTTPCDSPAPALLLSQLSLSGQTLTWSHAGTPESAQLH